MTSVNSSYSEKISNKKSENTYPYFLITIDTEGDNLWANPQIVTTRNASFLPRFQSLCERFGFKVCYLTDYDMARSPEFVAFASDALRRGTVEIGMHLHAWNTPPQSDTFWSTGSNHPTYLIEYPEHALRAKVAYMTNLLGEAFGVQARSHRAGRWAFNHVYARALIEHGYWIDCSVTPYISWQEQLGDPHGHGGTDYTTFPPFAYFVDPNDISKPGNSNLLEIPMTIMPSRVNPLWVKRSPLLRGKFFRWIFDHISPQSLWLRPKKDNLPQMLSILSWAKEKKHPYVEFMLHSSEFMPGGSPSFRTESDIEKLYDNLTGLFEKASNDFTGATLVEYHQQFSSMKRANSL